VTAPDGSDHTSSRDVRLAREEASRRITEAARDEQHDGVPVVNEDAPRPEPYHDPTPMAPGPSKTGASRS
jgi:hypothetical protein